MSWPGVPGTDQPGSLARVDLPLVISPHTLCPLASADPVAGLDGRRVTEHPGTDWLAVG